MDNTARKWSIVLQQTRMSNKNIILTAAFNMLTSLHTISPLMCNVITTEITFSTISHRNLFRRPFSYYVLYKILLSVRNIAILPISAPVQFQLHQKICKTV